MVEEDDFSDAEEDCRVEEERWRQEKAALRRAATELAHRRANEEAAALADLARIGEDDSFQMISKSLDDPSEDVRNAAVRALYDLNPTLTASFFNAALREASPERRRKIGAALAGSGLVSVAINNLTGESHENTYGAFSLLFLMAKAGEVRPLMRVIGNHPSIELRLAVIKLLALSGEPEIIPAFSRLAVRGSLPSELHSAVMEAISQISSKAR
jgi:HEAT repeat protein